MRGGIQALVAGVMLIANAGVVGRPATQAPGPRPAPCGQVDAITLLSYGIDGSVGNVHLQIIPDGARWFFRLTPQGGASASTPEYSGHLRVTRKISHAVDLVAQNPVAASTGGVQVRQATLPLRVRVDVGRALLTGQVVVGGRTRGIAIPLADAPGLAALACALPLIRARRWDNLYAHMALEYRRRYSRHAMAAALGNGAALVSATQPPNWTMGRQTAAPAAQFWGGRNLVAEFLTLRTGVEQATTVALYALRVGKDWTLVVAPPLACTLVTSKSGPFTCAIGLVTSDALDSYHLLVDGYNSGDGGLFPGQFAVINATLPWELEPGNHTVELRSDTQGSNAPDVGTAPITIPGAPTTPCPQPAAGPPPPQVGASLRIPGAFPGQGIMLTVDTGPATGTWDGFEIDVDGQINGSDPGRIFSPVGILVSTQAAPGWHTVSIYQMIASPGGGPWTRGPLYAQAAFLVFAPGHCVLPTNSTPPR